MPDGTRTSYWGRRLRRHALLGALALALTAGLAAVLHSPQTVWRLSMGTAYAALLFLVVSLAIGPLHVLWAQPNPVSTDLRRDVGIWAAVFGLLHVVFGIQVHMRGKFWLYFVYAPDQPHRLPLRHDMFGVTNWTGLGAAGLLLLLLAISNDLSLRRLGTRRWKWLQRWNYVLMGATVLHGALFQVIEKRQASFVAGFAALVIAASAVQVLGFLRVRRDRRPIA